MEVKRAILHDPIEVLIPLINADDSEFHTADVLATADMHVYYWDTTAGPAAYVEATFSGTVGRVLGSTSYLHRISMNLSMFSNIDTKYPIGISVIDTTATKVFKDTGFLVYLEQKIVVNLSTSPVLTIPAAGYKMLEVIAVFTDLRGNKVAPQKVDLGCRAITTDADKTDFWDDFGATVGATAGTYNASYRLMKLDGSEPGRYTLFLKVPSTEVANQLRFTCAFRPGTSYPWQLSTTQCSLTVPAGAADARLYPTIKTPCVQSINRLTGQHIFAIDITIRNELHVQADPFNNEVAVKIFAINGLFNFTNPGAPNDTMFDDITLTTASIISVAHPDGFYKLVKIGTGLYRMYVVLRGPSFVKHDDFQLEVQFDSNPASPPQWLQIYHHHVAMDMNAVDFEDFKLEFSTPFMTVMPDGVGYKVLIHMNIKDTSGELADPDSQEVALQGFRVNNGSNIDNTFLFDDITLSVGATISTTFTPGFYKAYRIAKGLYYLYFKITPDLTKDDLSFTTKFKVNNLVKTFNHHTAIEDTILDRTIDTRDVRTIFKWLLSMASGNFDLTVPVAGTERLTFKDQAGTTTLWQVDVTNIDRTRL